MGPPPRRGVPPATVAAMYRPARSFVDHLPWAEALENGAILLEDGRSAGAAWEIEPRGTEGRGGAWLAEVRNGLHDVLQDSFEEFDSSPWVVQTYTWREPDLSAAAREFRNYVTAAARGTAFSEAYAATLAAHYRGVARPGGLFRRPPVADPLVGRAAAHAGDGAPVDARCPRPGHAGDGGRGGARGRRQARRRPGRARRWGPPALRGPSSTPG